MSDLISVIIPVFKVEDFIEECIESVKKQTYLNFEVIVVDDGSPDKSIEIAKTLTKDDNRFKYISKANGGLSDARNFGIKVSTGKYITFIDSDDFIESNYLDSLYQTLVSNQADISIINLKKKIDSQQVCMISSKKYIRLFSPVEILDAMYDMKEYFYVALTVAQGKLYKRELFDEIQYPVGRKYEDSFTTYKLYLKSKKIAYLNDDLYIYRIREGSLTNSTYSLKDLDKLDMFEEKIAILQDNNLDTSRVERAYCMQLMREYQFLKQFDSNHIRLKEIKKKIQTMFWTVYKREKIKGKLKLLVARLIPFVHYFTRR